MHRVMAMSVLTARDLNVRSDREVADIIGKFLTATEAVVAHWVEYSRGVLLFVMAPGDANSGEFYIYDRKRGTFWLVTLGDQVFGGYSTDDLHAKMREFQLLDLAADPGRLSRRDPGSKRGNSFCDFGNQV